MPLHLGKNAISPLPTSLHQILSSHFQKDLAETLILPDCQIKGCWRDVDTLGLLTVSGLLIRYNSGLPYAIQVYSYTYLGVPQTQGTLLFLHALTCAFLNVVDRSQSQIKMEVMCQCYTCNLQPLGTGPRKQDSVLSNLPERSWVTSFNNQCKSTWCHHDPSDLKAFKVQSQPIYSMVGVVKKECT